MASERLWMRIDRGTCLLTREELEPSLTIALSPRDFARLLEGDVTPGELFLAQRLTFSGDVLLAARLTGLFEAAPEAAGPHRAQRLV